MAEALAEQASRPVDLGAEAARKKIAKCDRKLRQYRAALDAGADPVEVSSWINATKRARADAEAEARRAFAPASISSQEINDAIEALGGLVEMIVDAESGDKADLYRELGLRLIYRPQKQLVEARLEPSSTCASSQCPRPDTNQFPTIVIPLGHIPLDVASLVDGSEG